MFFFCIIGRWEHPKVQLQVVLEKSGIEPPTSGSQGITLIHYTTAASLVYSLLPGLTFFRTYLRFWNLRHMNKGIFNSHLYRFLVGGSYNVCVSS